MVLGVTDQQALGRVLEVIGREAAEADGFLAGFLEGLAANIGAMVTPELAPS